MSPAIYSSPSCPNVELLDKIVIPFYILINSTQGSSSNFPTSFPTLVTCSLFFNIAILTDVFQFSSYKKKILTHLSASISVFFPPFLKKEDIQFFHNQASSDGGPILPIDNARHKTHWSRTWVGDISAYGHRIYLTLVSSCIFPALVPCKGLEQRPMQAASEHPQLLVLTTSEP